LKTHVRHFAERKGNLQKQNLKCTKIQHMHINQNELRQAVFKVASFCIDASVRIVTAWLPCQSLAGQVCPMQTQCTCATCQRLWFDAARPFLASVTRLCSPMDSSADCSVARVRAEWSLVSWLSVTSPMQRKILRHADAVTFISRAILILSKGSTNYE